MSQERTPNDMQPGHHPRIVIIGAGFGGLYLVRYLVKMLARQRLAADITLLDRNNYFFFIPLLHEAMSGKVEMRHILHPLRQSLRRLPVTFHQTEVEGVDLEARTVRTRAGDFPYDFLAFTPGSVTNYFGNAQFQQVGFSMKSPDDAYRLRNHVIAMFEEAAETSDEDRRRQRLTFVMVGAGYTGQEVITELYDLIHTSLLRDYPMIKPAEIRLMMIDGHPDLPMPPNKGLARKALRTLRRKGIDLRFKAHAQEAGPGWVELADGERINTETLIWAAGVLANPLVDDLPGEKASMHRVPVLPTLQLPEHPEVLVLGDCAFFTTGEGKTLPPTAQVANQQGWAAAKNLVRLILRRPPVPFRYRHKVELETLGRYQAVSEVGAFRCSGLLGWFVLRVVYQYILPCWRERFRVAADWTLNLFFPPDSSCIKAESCPDDQRNRPSPPNQ
ncbi:MAG TPA: NAD(P)/FAD-dependent oxidoreductase [Armatimonadota bacterium]|jgi:NADH dehydrogenase